MNKHLLTLISAILLFAPTSFSQSYDKKFGVEINGGIREYHGDMGSALYFQRRPDYQAAGVAFGMYLNPSFDANVYGSVGDLGFYNNNAYDEVRVETFRQGFRARISTVMLGLTYKFNNGYLLAEDARIKPYLRGGWGASQSVSRLSHNFFRYNPNYSSSRSWIAAHWNLALGAKIRLTNSLDFVISQEFNYSFDDNYDSEPLTLAGARLNTARVDGNIPLHDAFLYHNAGFVYNFGSTGNSGYRIKDSDNDGISDKFDLCPKTPEGYEVDTVGCPLDDDNDGVINEEDKCPKTPGSVENNGCPDIDESLRESIRIAAKGIYFETAKDIIKAESFTNLDKVVEIMEKNPDFNLTIEGHTDNQGEASSNMTLSQNRANSVKRYLASKGIAESRMTAIGFGETQPVADNGSAEGRALNRRVDFKISY